MKNYINFNNENYDSFDNASGLNFWGDIAGGVLPICVKTKRVLLPYRSIYVNEGNTYGLWGGKLDDDENIEETVRREFLEETRNDIDMDLIPAYVFKTEGFQYHNFIGIVDEEFEPRLNWETESYKWVSYDELMNIQPKHFGLEKLLNDTDSLIIIKKYML
jgi:8-oxo-dGTP pyrophosphatase MutT (NUDIX family)